MASYTSKSLSYNFMCTHLKIKVNIILIIIYGDSSIVGRNNYFCLFITRIPGFILECAVLFWWYVITNHSCGSHGLYVPSAGTFDEPSVRWFDEEV